VLDEVTKGKRCHQRKKRLCFSCVIRHFSKLSRMPSEVSFSKRAMEDSEYVPLEAAEDRKWRHNLIPYRDFV
jgi:hypothetical protein